MTTTTQKLTREQLASLLFPTVAGVLAWLVWIWSAYVDGLSQPRVTDSVNWEQAQAETLNLSPLLTVLSLTILAAGAYLGRWQAIRAVRTEPSAQIPRARALLRFTTTVGAASTILTSLTAVSLFLAGFGMGSSDEPTLNRVLELYLPILGYTAVVVVLLVSLFTMRAPRLAAASPTEQPVTVDERALPSKSHSTLIALAFSVPIVVTALAMLAGLVVFDVTDRAPQVTVWLLIMAVIGVGIILGTEFAARALRESSLDGTGTGAATAANRTNFVLSLLFIAATLGMAIGYGSAAVYKLTEAASINLTLYGDSRENRVSVYGGGLKPNSNIEIILVPETELAVGGDVDAEGYISIEESLPALAPGNYELEVSAISASGTELGLSASFEVDSDGIVTQPKDRFESFEQARQPVTADWLLLRFVPALGLLLLAEAVAVITILRRNRPSVAAPLEQR